MLAGWRSGGLALALEQAATYIAKKHLSFSEYLKRWKLRREEVLARYDLFEPIPC